MQFTLGIDPRNALASIRVLNEVLSVPNQPASIQMLSEDAIAPLFRAVDGRGIPSAASGCGHAVPIKRCGYLACREPSDCVAKNSTHDLGLGFNDLALATNKFARSTARAHNSVSVAQTSRDLTCAYPASLATTHFQRMGLEEQRTHGALQAPVHLVGLTVGYCPDWNAQKGQAFEETGTIGLIAGQSINVLGQEDIKATVSRILQHTLELVATMDTGAGNSAIGIGHDYRPIAARGEIATKSELIVDRALL